MICLVSFSKFLEVLPAFTYARANGNLWNICLGVNIFNRVLSKTLATRAKSKGHKTNIPGHTFPSVAFIGNIPPLKALRVNSRPS